MKRRPFMILELTAAMALMTAVVAVLFSCYRDLVLAKSFSEEEKEMVLGKQRCILRLEQLFPKVTFWELDKDNRYPFIFDNGADLDPAFRGELEAMLYLDQDRLCMISWPNTPGIPRIDVLLRGVKQVSFEFFHSQTGTFETAFPEERPFMIRGKFNQDPIAFFL